MAWYWWVVILLAHMAIGFWVLILTQLFSDFRVATNKKMAAAIFWLWPLIPLKWIIIDLPLLLFLCVEERVTPWEFIQALILRKGREPR